MMNDDDDDDFRWSLLKATTLQQLTKTTRTNTRKLTTLSAWITCRLLVFFISAKEHIFSSPFVCLFVSGITQKLLSRFSQNSVKRRHTGQGRND